MLSTAGHILRRGIAAARASDAMDQLPPELRKEMDEAKARLRAPGAVVLLSLTVLFFLVTSFLLEYALDYVVATLTTVEDTGDKRVEHELADLLEEEEDEGDDKSQARIIKGNAPYALVPRDDEGEQWKDTSQSNPADLGEGTGSLPKPITRNAFATLRYLQTTFGFTSVFRGFKTLAFISMLLLIPNVVLLAVVPTNGSPLRISLINLLMTPLSIALHCAWTHAIIRHPSSSVGISTRGRIGQMWRHFARTWSWSYQLILPSIRSTITTLIVANGGWAILEVHVRRIMAGHHLTDNPWVNALLFLLAVTLYWLVTTLLFDLPASMALTRVEASLLPEGDAAVVPLDRTFGGRDMWWKMGNMAWWRYILANLGGRMADL